MSDQEPKAPMAGIVSEALGFLRTGGTPTWDEWRRMDVRTRGAFIAASRLVVVENAVRVGNASQGPVGVLDALSELDGGEYREDLMLQQAGQDLADRVNRRV